MVVGVSPSTFQSYSKGKGREERTILVCWAAELPGLLSSAASQQLVDQDPNRPPDVWWAALTKVPPTLCLSTAVQVGSLAHKLPSRGSLY